MVTVALTASIYRRAMNNSSRIIFGGGWKDARSQKVKIKAWSMLFLTIALGAAAVTGPDWLVLYSCILAGFSLAFSLVFFFREKPTGFPSERSGSDLRKLHNTTPNKK